MPKYPLLPVNTVLLPEFQDWTDKYGMTADNDQQDSSDNGTLFTAHYAYGLSLRGELDKEKDRLTQVFQNNFVEPGLLCRTPSFPGDYQAQDDMIGLMGAEALMYPDPKDRQMTKAMYEYGKVDCSGLSSDATPQDSLVYTWIQKLTGHTKWVWNNRESRKFRAGNWLGRFPNLMATMQMSLGESVNPFFWLWWAATMLQIVYMPNKGNQDGYTLRFHSALACEDYGPITEWICGKVKQAVVRDFGGLGSLLAAYFGKPNHPLVKLCN